MKIAVFWKKYNGTNHREIRRIYSYIFYGLSELGYDFDIIDQNYYQEKKRLRRASRAKFLKSNSWTLKKTKFNNDLPNMPFEGHHFKKGYDKSIMFHTIGNCPNTIHVKPSYFPGYFYFDSLGYSGWSEYSTMSNDIGVSYLDDNNGLLQDIVNRTKYSQPDEFEIPTSKPFLFVPLQVPSDSVSNLSDYSTKKFIDKVIMLSDFLNYDLIFKRHPKCIDLKIANQLELLTYRPNIHVSSGSVIELTNKSEGVIVVNSGAGIEALLKGKPVVTFGESDYVQLTYRFDSKTVSNDINDYISNFDEITKKNQIAQTYRIISNNFLRIGDIEELKKALQSKIGMP